MIWPLTGEMGRLRLLSAPGDGLFFRLAALMMFLAKMRWLALVSWLTAGDWHLVSQCGDTGEVAVGLKRVPADAVVAMGLWIRLGEGHVETGLWMGWGEGEMGVGL